MVHIFHLCTVKLKSVPDKIGVVYFDLCFIQPLPFALDCHV